MPRLSVFAINALMAKGANRSWAGRKAPQPAPEPAPLTVAFCLVSLSRQLLEKLDNHCGQIVEVLLRRQLPKRLWQAARLTAAPDTKVPQR